MELLLSNYPPMKTKCRTFSDMFYSMVPKSTELDIAVGYITSDSLMELQRIVELNTLKALNLTIGMHYLERFTKVEYNAALKLNDFLTENKCGEVRLVTPFRYHGKLYSYSDEQGAFAGIIGSNNLSSIVEGGTRVYESAVFLDDKNMASLAGRSDCSGSLSDCRCCHPDVEWKTWKPEGNGISDKLRRTEQFCSGFFTWTGRDHPVRTG